MRKAQKQQAEELVRQMEEAHGQLKKYIEQGSILSAMELLEECQNGGITLGTLIEGTEGEGHPTVSLLEEYCELSYQVHEQLSEKKEINTNKIYKLLRQKLIRISNSLKNDVRVRFEIAFFPYKVSMWDSLESVYLAAKEDPDCDAYCVPIPYYDLNPDRSFGKMHYEGNVRPDGTPIEYPKEIEITDWQEYNFEERRPDVIFIHNIYDNYNLVTSVHPRYYSSNLKQYTDRLVYIPYYMTSGGMSEGQSFLPSYMNADYIVIQSPMFREYFDARIPDEKFLPLGSPKADRVIRKCQNPPALPKEWGLSDAQLKSMTGKKVYFYNTSISGMLAATENFLKKMQYVFQCFEEHENVCILWRPHPLLEATFHSMRPEYEDEYKKLKKYFVEKEIGILDTTADIEDSIALSDAYIGDAGTSVTALFGVAGKPVFILNNEIHEKPSKDCCRKKIGIGFDFQERDQFVIIQRDKLYVSAPDAYNYQYFCDLSDGRCREYSQILQINDKKYACPFITQNILRIGKNGVEKKIELKKETVEGQTFIYGWKYDRYLILVPLNYPALVRFDTVTEECLYIREHMDVYIKETEDGKATGSSVIYQGSLYIAYRTGSKVCRFDIESGNMHVIELPVQSRCGCYDFALYRDEIWILPYTGKTLVRWNPQTGEVREYADYPEEFHCVNPVDGEICWAQPFSNMAFYGDYAYLAPLYGNMFLCLDIRTGQFTQWKIPFAEELENKNKNIFFLRWEPEGDCLMLYFGECKKLYSINMETDAWKEIEIRFDEEEIKEHAVGFCEHLGIARYACFENDFNSLDRILGGAIVRNSFDRDRQLSIYSEMIANIDGSCGRKTYRYLKEQIERWG